MDLGENLVNGFDGRFDRRCDGLGEADALVEGQWLASYDHSRDTATHAGQQPGVCRVSRCGRGRAHTSLGPDQVCVGCCALRVIGLTVCWG